MSDDPEGLPLMILDVAVVLWFLFFFKDFCLLEVIAKIFMNEIQCQLGLKIARKQECVMAVYYSVLFLCF